MYAHEEGLVRMNHLFVSLPEPTSGPPAHKIDRPGCHTILRERDGTLKHFSRRCSTLWDYNVVR